MDSIPRIHTEPEKLPSFFWSVRLRPPPWHQGGTSTAVFLVYRGRYSTNRPLGSVKNHFSLAYSVVFRRGPAPSLVEAQTFGLLCLHNPYSKYICTCQAIRHNPDCIHFADCIQFWEEGVRLTKPPCSRKWKTPTLWKNRGLSEIGANERSAMQRRSHYQDQCECSTLFRENQALCKLFSENL